MNDKVKFSLTAAGSAVVGLLAGVTVLSPDSPKPDPQGTTAARSSSQPVTEFQRAVQEARAEQTKLEDLYAKEERDTNKLEIQINNVRAKNDEVIRLRKQQDLGFPAAFVRPGERQP